MYKHVDKPKGNKSKTVSHGQSKMLSGGESTFQLFDNRPETIERRKLQEMANNNLQLKQSHQLPKAKFGKIERPDVLQLSKWKWNYYLFKWFPVGEVWTDPPEFQPGIDRHNQEYDDGIYPPSRVMYGEADFSYSHAYVGRHPNFGGHTMATSYESGKTVERLYPNTRGNTGSLLGHSVDVQHGVDATSHSGVFDVIHFNFPHTGNRNKTQGTLTSEMLDSFFSNCQKKEEIGSIVRMGLVNKQSYKGIYGLHKIVPKYGYELIKKTKWDVPGYGHKQTKVDKPASTAEGDGAEFWFKLVSKTQTESKFTDLHLVDTDFDNDSDDEREMFKGKKLSEFRESGTYNYNGSTHDMKNILSGIHDVIGNQAWGRFGETIADSLFSNTSMSDFLFSISTIDTDFFHLIQDNLPWLWNSTKK